MWHYSDYKEMKDAVPVLKMLKRVGKTLIMRTLSMSRILGGMNSPIIKEVWDLVLIKLIFQ